MKKEHRQALYELLAGEYNCAPDAFTREENVLTEAASIRGRHYGEEQYFFHMVSCGGNAVATAALCLHPFLRRFLEKEPGFRLFEQPNLRLLEAELEKQGYTLTATHHMFLPGEDRPTRLETPVRWYLGEEIHRFYGDGRFPNAICPRFQPERPDTMVVCAMDGETIQAMAGCSEDAPHWLQIGIDVLPEYRSRGLGTYLVQLLKARIQEQGDTPFYGTDVANYHSWNIALNAGFYPAWIEIGAEKK